MRTIDHPFGEAGGPTAVLRADPGAETVTIPDAALFAGEFGRSGTDLILEGPDGESLLVRDYFAGETPPDLVADGARLNGETVETLAGPLAPAQYAQTGPDAGTEAIGEVTELTGSATVVRTNGAQESLALGDPIFLGDTLRTGAGSSVGVTFIDDTLFSLSEDARLIIDQLIFNPGGGGNELSVSLLQGAAAFLAGQIAPSEGEGMKVTTPVATIGVRGTSVVMFYDAVQQILESILIEDPDGTVGVAGVTNSVSSQALTAFLEGVTVTGLDQLIGPPELVDPSVLLAAKFALVVQSLGLNYANFIQNIAPEAGPPQEGGGGGGGGVGEFDPVEGSEANLFLIGPRGELIELEILIDDVPEFVPPEEEDPPLIVQEIIETLTPDPPQLDLDDNNDTDDVLPGGTGGTSGAEAAFEEAGGDVTGTGAVPVVDEDITINFQGAIFGATVALTNPLDGDAEQLEVDEELLPPGITAVISDDGTLVTLTGAGTAADYEAALQAVSYVNDSENPTEADRVLNIVVNTAAGPSNTAISTIGVTATNDPPIIGIEAPEQEIVGGGADLAAVADQGPCVPGEFVEDDGPVIVSDKIEITDVDSETMASATATLNDTPDGDDETLGIDEGALAAIAGGAITAVLSADGTVLTLTGVASLEAYEAALALVTYENTSDDPTGDSRSISFVVNDGEDESDPLDIEISVTAVNDPPIANPDMNMLTEDGDDSTSGNVIEGEADGDVADEDADGPSPLAVTSVENAVDGEVSVEGETFVQGEFGGLTIFSDGSYDYIADFGSEEVDALNVNEMVTDSFTYTITDGEETDTATLDIKIKGANDAPEAGNDLANVMEAVDDAPSNTAEGNVIDGDGEGSEDSDVDNDRADLMVTEVEGDAGDVGQEIDGLFGTLILNADGSYTYTPDDEDEQVNGLGENDTLTESFTYTVSDGDLTDTATLEIVIDGKNDSPIAEDDNDEVMEATEEDEESFTAEGNVIDGSDSDVDSDIMVSAVQGNGANVGQQIAGTFGFLTLNGDGSYSYTPNDENEQVDGLNVGEMLTDTFTYTISDGDLTDTATLSIKINGKNDAPVANDDMNMVTEDAAQDTISGDVIDGDGNGGVADDDVDNEAVDLELTDIAFSDIVEAVEESGTEIEGDFGTLTIFTDGSYDYTVDNQNEIVDGLNDGDMVTDVFTYTLSDGDKSDTATLSIKVKGSNDGPIANPDMNMLTEDGDDTTSGNVLEGDANGGVADEDPDSGGLTVIDVDGEDPSVEGGAFVVGAFGTLTIFSDGSYDYVADFGNEEVDALNVDEMVTDSFTYTVSDGDETDTATLDIKIKGANDAPEASDDFASVMEAVDDAPSNTAEGNVIDGDGEDGEDTDVDNDRADLMVTEVEGEAGDVGQEIEGLFGTLILNADGSYTYTPDDEDEQVNGLGENDTLTETFTYTVSDGDLTDMATLDIVIDGENDSPVLDETVMLMTPERVLVFDGEPTGTDGAEDGDVVGTITATDAEDAPEDLTFTIDGGTGEDIFEIDAATGVITIAPESAKDLNFENQSSYSLDIITTDTDGATDSFTYMVEIKDINDAPEITSADDLCIDEDGGPLSLAGLQVTDPDADPDDNNLFSVTISVDSGDLLVDDSSEGTEVSLVAASLDDINAFIDSITFEPDLDFGGLVPLTVEVNDQNGDPDQRVVETFEIKVAPVADVPDIFVDDITVYEDNATLMTAGSFESGPFTFKEVEDNDPGSGTANGLGVLAPASVLAVTGSIATGDAAGGDDLDAYAFTLSESGLVSFDFETEDGLPPNLNLDMTLFNTTGSEFAVGAFNADEPFFLEAGTYRLELDGFAFDDGVPDVAYSAKISTTLEDKEPVWMALGDVSQQGTIGADPALAPTDGQFQLLLTTIEADSDADPKSGIPAVPVSNDGEDLNSFFGFEQGELEQSIFRLGPESEILEPVEGSGVKTTFTAEAGQVLTFDWTFLTNEDSDEGPFFDAPFAFVAPLALPSELPTGLETFITADDATMFERQIDGLFSYTIPATGTYMLGIGVVDIDDSSADSALAIDNVELDDAPLMSMFFDTDTLHRLPIFTSVVDQDGSETISELTITATIDSKAPLSDITFDGPDPTAFFVLDGRVLTDGDDINYFDDEGIFGISVDITDGELTLGFGSDGPVDLDPENFGIDLGRHFSGEVILDVTTTVLDDDPDVPPAQSEETNTATFTLTIEGVADKAEIVDLGGADPEETEDGTPIIAIAQEDAEDPVALPFAVSTPDMDGSECLKSLRLTSLDLNFADPELFWTFEDEAITGTELAKQAVTLPNLLPGSEDDVDALIWLGGPNGDVLNVEFVDPTLDLREVEIKEIGLQLPENLNGDIKLDIEATTEEHGGPDGLPVMAGAETATQTDWFVLRVEPMNDAPVLEEGNDFTPIAQDDDDSFGNYVSFIVSRGDVDQSTNGGLPEAFDEGMAIIGKDSTGGTWEFSLDDGTTWNSILTVSPTSALLLRSTDKVRFVPNESYVEDSDFGTDGASLTYRAWDGAPDAVNNIPEGDTAVGGYWAILETGGKTAFSDGTDTANAQVVAALDINMIITTGSTEASPIPLGILLDGLTEDPAFFTDSSSLPEYLGFGAAIGIGAGAPLFTQTSTTGISSVIGTDMLPTGDGLTEVSSFLGLPIAEFTYEVFTASGAAATTSFNYSVTGDGTTDSASIGIDIRATFDMTDRIGGDGIDIIYANPNLEFNSFLPTLFGGGGDDMLVGLDGGEGADNLFGGGGDDLIFGLDSVNFAGFTGNDQIGGDGDADLTTQGGNDLLFGGDGNDDISGDTGLFGGDIGNSKDAGFAGDDKAFGGAGNDKIYGDAQNNWVKGTLGDDMLFGGADDDDLFGDVGNSIVVTASKGNVAVSGGDDMLVGDNSEGTDNLFGDAGLDLGAQSRGSNVASVIGGNDQLFGDNEDGSGAQADMLFGDAGRNILAGDAGFDGSDVLATGGSATGGDDTASGAGGNDTIIGDAGNDLLGGDAFASTTLVGGLALGGDDILSGEDNDDLVIGDAGGDLSGGDADTSGVGGAAQGGNDSLFGGAGIDTLVGDAGDDLLAGDVFGGSPADDVTGGDAVGGDDNIMGGDANDQISGDAGGSLIGGSISDASAGVISRAGTARGGDDTLNGEMGDDTISGDAGQSLSAGDAFGDAGAILAGGDAIGGNDTLMGEEGNDTLFGDAVTFLSSAPEGGDAEAIGGDDELFGGMGNDDLFGDAGTGFFSGAIGGDDSLFGGAGNDSLIGDTGETQFGGEAGDDFIDGGAGNDDLWGDSQTLFGTPITGSDVFFYDLNENSGDDTIHDFEVEKDILRLTELLSGVDTVAELDLDATFTVAQTGGAGSDVVVTLGQGGGEITIQDIGTATPIDSFQDLDNAINLEINP